MKIFHKLFVSSICGLSVVAGSGCSGGSGTQSTFGGVTPTQPGPTTPLTGSAVKRQFKIFIPAKTAQSAARLKSAASTRRMPQYVSSATLGVGIVTSQGKTQIDSESFSTNPSDNTNCSQTLGGSTCIFTVGVLGGSDTIAVSAYNLEPTAPTGGNATAFPFDAELLSSTSANVSIALGANTTIGLTLGGVPAFAELTSATYPKFATTGAITPTSTIGGQGPSSSTTVGLETLDAAGNIIVGNDILAAPVTVALQETGGHTTIAVRSTDDDGNVTTSRPSPSIELTRAKDAVVIAYDGAAPSGYEATFTMSFAGTAGPNGLGSIPSETGHGSLAPLFLSTFGKFEIDAPHATLGLDTNGLLMLSETIESGPSENPMLTFNGAARSSQPSDSTAPSGVPKATAACASSNLSTESSSPFVAEFTGGPAQTCVYKVGDGTTGGQEEFETKWTPPTGVSLYPSSYVGQFCNEFDSGEPDVPFPCDSAYQFIDIAQEFSTAESPSFTIVSCQADNNSGCANEQNFNVGKNSNASCMNNSGYLEVDQDGPSRIFTEGYTLINDGSESSDSHAQNTGNFSCTFGISDGTNTTLYSLSFFVDKDPALDARKRLASNSKASLAYGGQHAAYLTFISNHKASSPAIEAKWLAILRSQKNR